MNMKGDQAEHNAPVSLSDGVGGHNNFIEKNIIPRLLEVIESSGLSFEDAKLVPHTYYKHREENTIRQYEYENFIFLYKAYKKMGGNSFIDKIYKEVQSWEVLS